jgi:hypothetical protein
MTTTGELLVEAYGRIGQVVHAVVDGMADAALAARLDPDANSIGWLVWHLTRIQDDHVAHVAATEQVWTARGWSARFALPFETSATGYGQSSEDVSKVRVTAQLLTGYYDDVQAASTAYLAGLSDAELERIVDERWDPPVSLAVRLVSVLSDDLQHAGQAAFVKGRLTSSTD